MESIKRSYDRKPAAFARVGVGSGYGGHWRAVQSFKYIGEDNVDC